METMVSGVGVLDKSFALMAQVQSGPVSLNELVERTGFTRATAHRLAVALERHGMLRRTVDGRFALGLNLIALGRFATEQFPLTDAADQALVRLRDQTGESVQLYVRDRDHRVCVAALESPHGLRTIVPLGAVLPMDLGSAGRVLGGDVEAGRWLATSGEREAGVASVSAAIFDPNHLGDVIAAVSVSGPTDRMGPEPGERHGEAVVQAALATQKRLLL